MIIKEIDYQNITVQMSHTDAVLLAELLDRVQDNQLRDSAAGANDFCPTLGGDDALLAAMSFKKATCRTLKTFYEALNIVLKGKLGSGEEKSEAGATIKPTVN